jgi:hypothetical protein
VANEKLYGHAKDTLPSTVVGLSLHGEAETWTNIARLATAIVTACDHRDLPSSTAGVTPATPWCDAF